MVKKAEVCSVQAGQLAPEDAKRYITKRKHSTKQAFVDIALKEATTERQMIIDTVQRRYPELITRKGEFVEDVLAQQYEDKAQADMFTKAGKVRAAVDKNVVAGKERKADAEAEAKKETRREKQRAARMAKKEQAASAAATASRDAADTPPKKSSKSDTLKAKGNKPKATKAGGKSAKPKKSSNEASQSKRTGPQESEQAERENEQPLSIDKDAMRDAGFTSAEINNPGRLDPTKIRQAAEGYAYVGGDWRLVTADDASAMGQSDTSTRAKWGKAFAKLPAWTGTGNVQSIFGSDAPAQTMQQVQDKVSGKTLSSDKRVANNYQRQLDRQKAAKVAKAKAFLEDREKKAADKKAKKNAITAAMQAKNAAENKDKPTTESKKPQRKTAEDKADERALELEAMNAEQMFAGVKHDLETTSGAMWRNAVEMLFNFALVEKPGNKENKNTKTGKVTSVKGKWTAWQAANVLVNDETSDLLYYSNRAGATRAIFMEMLTSSATVDVRKTSAPSFLSNMGLWQYALDHGLFARALAEVRNPTGAKAKTTPILEDNPTGDTNGAKKKFQEDIAAALPDDFPTKEKDGTEGSEQEFEPTGRDTAPTGAEIGGVDTKQLTDEEILKAADAESEQYSDGAFPQEESLRDLGIDSRAKIFRTEDGKPITKPLPRNTVERIVDAAILKFNKAVRPAALTFKNLAEFKRKKPDLHKQAVASRKDGKDIPANAAGYAFGRHVIIFSDNIATRDQLNFTIAHEVIGHFGLASIMPKAQFHQMLDMVYAQDPKIRAIVDVELEMAGKEQGKPTSGADKLRKGKPQTSDDARYEAIEEALADAAAVIDTKLVHRIAAAIKRFLSKVFNFNDDVTRYFIHHSRRYQRLGITPDASPYAVFQEFKTLQDIAGRAMLRTEGTAAADEFQTLAHELRSEEGGEFVSTSTRFIDKLKGGTSLDGAADLAKAVTKGAGKAAEWIQTMDNIGLRNPMVERLFGIMSAQKRRLERIRSDMGVILKWATTPKILWFNKDAPTIAELKQFSDIAPFINAHSNTKLTAKKLKELETFVTLRADGFYDIDKDSDGWVQATSMGKVTKAEIEAGLEFQVMDRKGRPGVERDAKDGIIYYDLNGAVSTEAAGGMPKILTDKVVMTREDGSKITVNDNVMRLIEDHKLAIDTAAAESYVNKLNGFLEEQQDVTKFLADKYKRVFAADEDSSVLGEVEDMFIKLYEEDVTVEAKVKKYNDASIKRAKAFLHHAVRLLDTKSAELKVKDWQGKGLPKDNIALYDFIKGLPKATKKSPDSGSHADMVKPLIDKLTATAKGRVGKGGDSAHIEATIDKLLISQSQVLDAELYAKSTMASAYIPLKRRGKYQVRITAFQKDEKTGKYTVPVRMAHNDQAQMYYTRTDSEENAKKKAVGVQKILNKYDGKPVSIETSAGETVDVVFRANWSTASQGASTVGSINYDDVATVLIRSGVALSPTDRENLIVLTSAENALARDNLRKDMTPGWDPDISLGITEHVEQQAHIAAKNRYHHKVTRMMMKPEDALDSWWEGSAPHLKLLQDKLRLVKQTNEVGSHAEILAYQEMVHFQRQHIHSASSEPEANIPKMDRAGNVEMVRGLGKGNYYHDKMLKVVNGYDRNMEGPSTGDDLASAVSSGAMTITALIQLGGSIVSAAINSTSLGTHTLFYLATLNGKTGYGGGHGMSSSVAAVMKAGSDLSLFKDLFEDVTGDVESLKKLAEDTPASATLREKYNLSLDEAIMLYDKTREGETTPNMFHPISDVMRKSKFGKSGVKVAEAWMMMFAKTEQYNRRVTALASYRLDKARMIAASGDTNPNRALTLKEKNTLYQRVTDAVNYSQGNYDNFNRPAFAQGNFISYLYMYKQFQTITVQLMRNLGGKERTYMLVALLLLSGVKGVPFADDLMDLIDTLMQMFDIKWGGMEMVLSELTGEYGQYLMHGIANSGGLTVSNRLGHGDLVPGTRFFVEGVDQGREMVSILGPVISAWAGILDGVGTVAAYAAETVGLKEDTTTAGDVFKAGLGVSALKNLAKGIDIFMQDGTIINNRGQVVAKDVGWFVAIGQMIGFYPATATHKYAAIRVLNEADAYAKALKTSFRETYNKAKTNKERSEVNRMVADWNRHAKGTLFEVLEWKKGSLKSKKKAEQDAVERAVGALSKGAKKHGAAFLKSQGFDTKGRELRN